MADSVIERVARALAEADGRVWTDTADILQEHFSAFARAVLTAMQEPTPDVLAAGFGADTQTGDPKAVWKAMIGAALEGK